LRQFFFSNYQYLLYHQLQSSGDERIAAIAEKSLKEVTYHLRWSSEWVIRLGDGTEESHKRINTALAYLWPYTGELTTSASYEVAAVANGIGADVSQLREQWLKKVSGVFEEATLTVPEMGWMQSCGKTGRHTEHLGYILAEMQYLQRAYPGAEW
jgi:ring-1,2-phenylacetyl-CoA epoxidase subunit PaaC